MEMTLGTKSTTGRWPRWGLALLLVAGSALAAAPDDAALLTVLDGDAVLEVGAKTLRAAEGVRLAPTTLVRTGPRTALLRLEFNDGSLLDLGPDTQVMLVPPGLVAGKARAPAAYLLQGWAKLSGQTPAGAAGLVSPTLAVLPFKGVLVAHVGADEEDCFQESGTAQLQPRGAAGGKVKTLGLKAGEMVARKGDGRAEVLSQPSSALLQGLPRSFRDTLPARAAHWQGKRVEARPAPPTDYAGLAPWLTAEPALRRHFPRRFAARAREPAFRAALVEQLSRHPEWERSLFPERFVDPASAPVAPRPAGDRR
jgi:hypothetical protein